MCVNCEQKHTSANDALLQTGALDARTARFEKDSSPEMEAQMLSRTQSLAPGKLGEPFFNAMHKMTGDYFASQGSSAGDCGVPGGATDRRRAGCIIPISGPTEDMACCTSCCQGLMGECGPCEGLREGIEHTDKRKAVPIQTAVEAESVDCGVPGSPNDRRRQGCIIPAVGSTASLECCETCCHGAGGECGDCSGLSTEVEHTAVSVFTPPSLSRSPSL